MVTASLNNIPAVDPNRKLSNPACCPFGKAWITVSKTTPKAKKTDKTEPIAAS